jgi:hypothetical protein
MFHVAREHTMTGEAGNKERNALRERLRGLIFDLVCARLACFDFHLRMSLGHDV